MAKNIDRTLKTDMPSGKFSSKGVAFERLALKDEEEYLDFLMAAYRDQFNSAAFKDREKVRRSWRWEYVDNPNAPEGEPLIWLCRLKGRIIAQACLMPVELKADDKYCKAGWCQNLMILPEFRNVGLGYFLLKHVMSVLRKGEIDILLAAGTNENSYSLLKGLGFSDLGFINRNIRPSLFGLAGLDAKGPVRIIETDGFGPDFDSFWSSVSRNFPCIVKRDSKNLRWRFKENPYWSYKVLCAKAGDVLQGYAVLKEGRLKGRLKGIKVGAISDILFDPKDKPAGLTLLAGACAYLRKRAGVLRCDMLCGEMQRFVKSAGFLSIRSNNRFLVYPVSEELKARKSALEDRRRWCLTYGDSDLDLF